jgi:hypothetical protein
MNLRPSDYEPNELPSCLGLTQTHLETGWRNSAERKSGVFVEFIAYDGNNNFSPEEQAFIQQSYQN